MKILIDKDWSSSCFWVPGHTGGWASCDHHSFELPLALLQRCDFLSDWFETYQPGSREPEPDWGSYSAYKRALAIDVKRHYGDSAQVYVYSGKHIVEITGSYSNMMLGAT